ncbi:hypothetical protein JY651_26755 [Pyxidicoccus parkwayensis]|uniref:Lipoprotein n=1 Tax=Pyxidicoccus parkwayensis TaxID=2813578 RepID=A0ABX7NS14_9BACT|nr:hypothetical protein [Pyxidicoccus parkwaysis]QSQ18953.1 hypothetical protein JY651_26755 [Pyxidicoccus parkwaysis]
MSPPEGTPAAEVPVAAGEVTVVSEWRAQPLVEGASRREVGEECTRGGNDECGSGRCIHVPGAARGQGYVCTRECRQDAECPQGWACVSVVPGAQVALCQPGSAAQDAEVRR